MSTIKTTFDSGADDQDISIENLSAREMSLDEAKDSLRLSPGLLIILPRGGTFLFQMDSGIIEVAPNGGVIASGYAKGRLTTIVEGEDESRLPVLEIAAVINGTSRLKDHIQLPYLLDTDTSEALSQLYQMLIDADDAPQQEKGHIALTKHLIAGQVVNTLLSLSNRSAPEKQGLQKGAFQVNQLKKFLFDNLHRKITTVDMATVVGMSRDHFCVWAKSQLGKPPARFLRELRMERSLDKLLNSEESIESISEQIGYADRYHFGKEFKKHFGAPPAQLRKEHARRDRNYVSRAETSLKLHKFNDALALCEEGLSVPGVNTADQNQLKLFRGHGFKSLGEYSKAMDAWMDLNGSNLGWKAGVLRCQLSFEYDHIDTAIAEMARLWSLEGAHHEDLIQVWIQHVTILCNRRYSQPLRSYLDFRKDHFITHTDSEHSALVALRGIGCDLEIPEQCRSLKSACFRALRRSALYERAIADYGNDVGSEMITRIYIESGDYERVLSTNPLIPRYCSQALVEMDKAEDAIRAFPEESGYAYITLKRYEELLEAVPEINQETIYAQIALGRFEELRKSLLKGSYYYEWAQCYLDPESIIKEKVPDTSGHLNAAQILTVLKCLTQGQHKDALSLLNEMETVRSPNLWPWLQNAGVFLLVSVMKALLGQEVNLNDDLEMICKNYRYLVRQTIYYNAAYLRGTIDAEEFQSQPMKHRLFNRWVFIRALSQDLEGNRDEACKGYRKLLEKATDFELGDLVKYRFSEWRLAELSRG